VLVAGDFDCPQESTTLYKAAMLFLQRQGIRARLRISVDKGIPAKAGLGGGSADAAALLSLLNKAFNAGLNSGELAALGLAVGSDVPFFFRGGTALVHGRGELVETLPPLRALGILLICPSFGVSTAWAYNSLDSYRTEQHEVLTPGLLGKGSMGTVKREFIEALGRPLSCWKFKNDFSPLLYREYPVYKEIEALLRSMGAAFVSITGSGASIFGLFDSLENAREAKKRLLEEGRDRAARKLLYGMALHAIKPLETSLRLG
jgi:4-diphosphocytidyl-2-C-methyl-D-erythritol kinase